MRFKRNYKLKKNRVKRKTNHENSKESEHFELQPNSFSADRIRMCGVKRVKAEKRERESERFTH